MLLELALLYVVKARLKQKRGHIFLQSRPDNFELGPIFIVPNVGKYLVWFF